MKRTNLTIGLILLFVAAAVAVYTTDGPGEKARALLGGGVDKSDAEATRGSSPTLRLAKGQPAHDSSNSRNSILASMRVEPSIDHPAIAAQADRVQRGAHARLEELNDGLLLTQTQQREIFPLLVRSHPQYSGSVHMVGATTALVDPLGKTAAQKLINKLLDPDQKLEMEIMSLEAEAWWTDIIAALERDLNESTKTLTNSPLPDHDPTPRNEDPIVPQTLPSNSAGRGRSRSGLSNLGVE